MSTTAFRDPRLLGLNSQDSSDPKNLSNQANDSIGWKDVQGENQEACCLGGGTFIQSRRPMGEECAVHGDCVGTEVGEDGEAKATNIKCFDKHKPHEYVKEGETGICRREKEGDCFDRVVFPVQVRAFRPRVLLGDGREAVHVQAPREQTATGEEAVVGPEAPRGAGQPEHPPSDLRPELVLVLQRAPRPPPVVGQGVQHSLRDLLPADRGRRAAVAETTR